MIVRDNDRISLYQLFVIYTGVVLGVATLSMTRDLNKAVGNNGWIFIIAVSIIMIIIGYMVCYVNRRFDDKNFLEISKIIIGTIPAYILIIFLTVYFMMVSSIEVRTFTEMSKNLIFDNTPTEIIVITFIFLIFILAKEGIEPIARVLEILFIVGTINMVLLVIIILPSIDTSNILPLMYFKGQDIFKGFVITLLSFAGIETLFIIMPNVKWKYRSKKYIFSATVFILIVQLLLYLLVTLKYGSKYAAILNFPVMSLMKDIYVKDAFIENPQIIALVSWMIMAYASATIYFYAAMTAFKQIIKKESKLVVPIVFSVALYFMSLFSSNYAAQDKFKSFVSYYLVPVAMLAIPIILFLTLLIKERMGKFNEK